VYVADAQPKINDRIPVGARCAGRKPSFDRYGLYSCNAVFDLVNDYISHRESRTREGRNRRGRWQCRALLRVRHSSEKWSARIFWGPGPYTHILQKSNGDPNRWQKLKGASRFFHIISSERQPGSRSRCDTEALDCGSRAVFSRELSGLFGYDKIPGSSSTTLQHGRPPRLPAHPRPRTFGG